MILSESIILCEEMVPIVRANSISSCPGVMPHRIRYSMCKSNVEIWLFDSDRIVRLKLGEMDVTRFSKSSQRGDASGMLRFCSMNSRICRNTSELRIASSIIGCVLFFIGWYLFRLSFKCLRSVSSFLSVCLSSCFCCNSEMQTRAFCNCKDLRLISYLSRMTMTVRTRTTITAMEMMTCRWSLNFRPEFFSAGGYYSYSVRSATALTRRRECADILQ